MAFDIVQGVPVPERPRRGGVGQDGIYPWRKMRPGDVFFVPLNPREDPSVAIVRLRNAGRAWAKRNGSPLLFVVRPAEHDGRASIGVWATTPE